MIPPFQQRVIDEKAELDVKWKKLKEFMGGETYNSLPEGERNRLLIQEFLMTQYSLILAERIRYFEPSP